MQVNKSSRVLTLVTGGALLLSPVLLQIPFGILATKFVYPRILRETPQTILELYAVSMPGIIAVWYAFALAIVPLLAGIAMLPAVASVARPRLLSAATPFGIASGVLQMAGLLRWVFVVPFLATAYSAAAPEDPIRATIAVAFEAQHRLFGVLLGEHLGQLFLAAWTAAVALSLSAQTTALKAHRALGVAAALLFLLGMGDSLATVDPALRFLGPVPAIAFVLWSVWCALLGWIVIRRGTGDRQPTPVFLRRHSTPAPEVAMEHARFRKSQ